MRILLVDDEEPMVELLASFSTREGREVTVCTSSLEAFSRIAAAPPDVLITDIVMAQLDGLSLVREARKIDAHLEAIVITGFGSAYPMEEVLQCGASDLILKPVRMREFRQGGLAIERRRVHRAHGRQRELLTTSTELIDGLERELEEAARQTTSARRRLAS